MNIFPSDFTYEDYDKVQSNYNISIMLDDKLDSIPITNDYVIIENEGKENRVKIIFNYKYPKIFIIGDNGDYDFIGLEPYKPIMITEIDNQYHIGNIIIKEFDCELDRSNLFNFVCQYNTSIDKFIKSVINYCESKFNHLMYNDSIKKLILKIGEYLSKYLSQNEEVYYWFWYYSSINNTLVDNYTNLTNNHKELSNSVKIYAPQFLERLDNILDNMNLPMSIVIENINAPSNCNDFVRFLIVHFSTIEYYNNMWLEEHDNSYTQQNTKEYYIKECLLRNKFNINNNKDVMSLIFFLISKQCFDVGEIRKIRGFIKNISDDIESKINFILNVDSVIDYINDHHIKDADNIRSAIELLSEALENCFNKIDINPCMTRENFNKERYEILVAEGRAVKINFDNILNILSSYSQKFDYDMATKVAQFIEIENDEEKREKISRELNIDYDDVKFKADRTIIHFLDEKDFPFKKPYKFVLIEDALNKREMRVGSWRKLFVGACEILHGINEELFASFLNDKEINGKNKCSWFSTRKHELAKTDPIQLRGTTIFVKGNPDSLSACRVITKMLERFNMPANKFQIYLDKDFSSLHVKVDNNDVLEEPMKDDTIYHINYYGCDAYGKIVDDGFLLLKESHVYKDDLYSHFLSPQIKKILEESKNNGNIIDDVLTQDILLPSPHIAAQFVIGKDDIDDLSYWKSGKGETLEYKRLNEQKSEKINV